MLIGVNTRPRLIQLYQCVATPIGVQAARRTTRFQLPPLTSIGTTDKPAGKILQRVDLADAATTLRLDRDVALKAWRRDATRGLSDADLIAHHGCVLTGGEVCADRGDHIQVTLPVRAKFRGGDSAVIAPATGRAPIPDAALIKAVARAHHWKTLMLSGKVTSIDALATRFSMERRHAGRILSLAFLSPDITRAILQGRQPPGLRLTHLLDADMPIIWSEQETYIRQIADHKI